MDIFWYLFIRKYKIYLEDEFLLVKRMCILGFDKGVVEGVIYFFDDNIWKCLLILDIMNFLFLLL